VSPGVENHSGRESVSCIEKGKQQTATGQEYGGKVGDHATVKREKGREAQRICKKGKASRLERAGRIKGRRTPVAVETGGGGTIRSGAR